MHLARPQYLALARDRATGDLIGVEGQPDAVVANRLNPRHRGWRCMARPFSRLIQLVGVQPDDRCQPVARHVLRLQPDLDLEGLVVHLDQPAAKVVAVPRADQVCGRVSFLHPGKREQAFTFRFGDPDGRVSLGRELNGLDLVVGHERAGRQRGAKGDAVLVDAGDVGRNDVTGAQIERPALVWRLGRRVAGPRECREEPGDEPAGALRLGLRLRAAPVVVLSGRASARGRRSGRRPRDAAGWPWCFPAAARPGSSIPAVRGRPPGGRASAPNRARESLVAHRKLERGLAGEARPANAGPAEASSAAPGCPGTLSLSTCFSTCSSSPLSREPSW